MSGRESLVHGVAGLKELVRIIDSGEAGKKVILPLKEASLALRIPIDGLRKMGLRKQSLEIEVSGNNLEVILRGSETDRKEAYRVLYAIVQNWDDDERVKILLGRGLPLELKEEIPALKEIAEVIGKGTSCLTNEDRQMMMVELFAYFVSLKDRSNLPGPENALSSVAY